MKKKNCRSVERGWWGRLIIKNDWYFIREQNEIPMTLTEIRIRLCVCSLHSGSLLSWNLNQRYFVPYASPLWNPSHLCHTQELLGRMPSYRRCEQDSTRVEREQTQSLVLFGPGKIPRLQQSTQSMGTRIVCILEKSQLESPLGHSWERAPPPGRALLVPRSDEEVASYSGGWRSPSLDCSRDWGGASFQCPGNKLANWLLDLTCGSNMLLFWAPQTLDMRFKSELEINKENSAMTGE